MNNSLLWYLGAFAEILMFLMFFFAMAVMFLEVIASIGADNTNKIASPTKNLYIRGYICTLIVAMWLLR